MRKSSEASAPAAAAPEAPAPAAGTVWGETAKLKASVAAPLGKPGTSLGDHLVRPAKPQRAPGRDQGFVKLGSLRGGAGSGGSRESGGGGGGGSSSSGPARPPKVESGAGAVSSAGGGVMTCAASRYGAICDVGGVVMHAMSPCDVICDGWW